MPVWLVTGGSGFLGRHVLDLLDRQRTPGVELAVLGRRPPRDWRSGAFVATDLNDPAAGPRIVSENEFEQCFTGVVLVFQPGPDFERGGSEPRMGSALRARLRGSESGLLYVVLASLASGWVAALSAFILFLGVHALESYVLTPIIQRQALDIPPATLFAFQILLGVVFGLWGLALALPLMAIGKVVIDYCKGEPAPA